MPTAEIITIGTEILLGEILDTNAQYLARALRDAGIDLYRKTTVGDNAQRIAQVIRTVYERLGNWLNKNKPKNTLFAYYSDLGAQRCREGIPLDEVIMVLMLIKREIWHTIRDQISVDSGFTLNLFMEINFYVNLFFDRIIHSTVTGYQNELGKICEKTGGEKSLLSKIFKK